MKDDKESGSVPGLPLLVEKSDDDGSARAGSELIKEENTANSITVSSWGLRFIRWTLCLLLTLLLASPIGLSASRYLRNQAEPFTPPVGHVFPREPVLKGEYSYQVLIGRTHIRTMVDGTPIFCETFSYYDATMQQTAGRNDCNRLMRELQGKQVEVHRVQVPRQNKDARLEIVVKIISEGRVYRDFSDAQIRERWIHDTNRDVGAVVFDALYFCPLLWPISAYVINRVTNKRKQRRE